jgi:hypothetical protein
VPFRPAVHLLERPYGEPIRDAGRPGARRCGQAVDRQWAESPSSLHGRPSRLSRMRRERGSVGVVLPASSVFNRTRKEGAGMRIIGLDIHRGFAEAVAWEGGRRKRLSRVDSHLRPRSSPRCHPCARGEYRRFAKKALVDHISGPGMAWRAAGVLLCVDFVKRERCFGGQDCRGDIGRSTPPP